MLAKLSQLSTAPKLDALAKHRHVLFILPYATNLSDEWPGADILKSLLDRRNLKPSELAKSPVTGNLPGGTLASWVMFDANKAVFPLHAVVRSALQPLLGENPAEARNRSMRRRGVSGSARRRLPFTARGLMARCCPNAKRNPRISRSKRSFFTDIAIEVNSLLPARGPKAMCCAGNLPHCRRTSSRRGFTGNAFARLRRRMAGYCREYDYEKLKKMGAGAFCAVAQGSDVRDAAIVHVRYSSGRAKEDIALIGKGICFDTGGHNLKPATLHVFDA